MGEVLRTENLSAGYGGRPVVEHIALLAEPGRILTLIGPNGAGKSTILRTLIRQLPPVAGAVYLDGRDLSAMGEREVAKISAAVLTERPAPELMTCRDVVSAGRYPYTGRLGILSGEDKRKVTEAMELMGVAELADRDFGGISDGQRQRVMLARAICQEPRLLIMDEPTSFLDIRHKLDLLYRLKSLVWERRLAVVLSMHELDLAQKFSDLILCLRDGRIDRTGTPEEIFRDGYIEALYAVERGRYDPRFGSVEPAPISGTPRVFVLGGGGSGIPVYRRLRRMGVPFAAGVLAENDMDLPVAEALAAEVVRDRAFQRISPAAVDRALALLASCEHLVCCCGTFGDVNRENLRLVRAAEAAGKLLPPEELSILENQA